MPVALLQGHATEPPPARCSTCGLQMRMLKPLYPTQSPLRQVLLSQVMIMNMYCAHTCLSSTH